MIVGRSRSGGTFWTCLALLFLFSAAAARGDDASSPSAAPPKDDGFNLMRLAELEEKGNGGAEETTISPSPPILAGYDKKEGFFLRSSDDLFLLKISGRLQIRYTYKARDPRGEDPDTIQEEGRDQSFLEIERSRITFSGHVLVPELNYVYSADGDTDDSGTWDTFYAYIYFQLSKFFESEDDIFSVGVGQWKPHFTRQEPTSSGKFQFVDRSLATEFFNIDKELGLWANGGTGPIWYEVAVTNGFDSANVPPGSVDQVPAFIGKLDFTLLGENEMGEYAESNLKCSEDPLLVLGLSGATDFSNATNVNAAAGDPQWTCYTFGLDATFKWSIFSIQAEYMGRWLRYQNAAALGLSPGSQYAQGFYVQAGVFLVPSELELVARASAIYSDDPTFSGSGVEAGPGFNWYISKSHKIKWQTYVVYFDVSDDLPPATETLDNPTATFSSASANLQEGEQGVMLETQIQLEF